MTTVFVEPPMTLPGSENQARHNQMDYFILAYVKIKKQDPIQMFLKRVKIVQIVQSSKKYNKNILQLEFGMGARWSDPSLTLLKL